MNRPLYRKQYNVWRIYMDEILLRLKILLDTKQIDEKNFQNIVKLIEIVEEELLIIVSGEKGSMFVTHMAIALMRIQKGEYVPPMDKDLLDEIESSIAYKSIPKVIDKIEQELNINIPESERGYIALHLCNLQSTDN